MLQGTLGHYEIIGKLGAGGMGEVYRAHDQKLGRDVALKVLPAALAADPERRQRFEREARAVAALKHPHIITLHSIEEVDGVHFITMELAEGDTLESEIVAGGVTLERFLDIALPLSDALATAHAKGVAHRDLKPANIMHDADGRLKVLDFGLAKLFDVDADPEATRLADANLTGEGNIVGTVAYMSPEQVEGQAIDARSDVFSLGVVLYELATGQRPFQGRTAMSILSAILKDDPVGVETLRPSAPLHLGRILERCLAKPPDRRYPSAREVRDELEVLRRELQETSSEQSGKHAHQASRTTRRPLPWVVGGLLLLVVLFVLQRRDTANDASSPVNPPTSPERRLSQLTFGSELEEWPVWSPDGASLVYAAEVDGFLKLFRRNVTSGEVQQLTRGHGDDVQPSWSPDGKLLVYVHATRDDGKLEPDDLFGIFFADADLWQLDLHSGDSKRLIDNAFAPDWSPDGSQLALQANWAGAPRIWVTDRSGHNPRQVTTDKSEAVEHVEPVWSPDGTRIVYRRREKSKSDLQVVTLATGSVVSLTDDSYRDLHAQWTADGTAIVFSSYRGGGQNIWRQPVGVDGSPAGPAEQWTTGAGNDVMLSMSPDGDQLAFTVLGINSDLWRLPLDPLTGQANGGASALVSTTREDSRGAWSPDGGVLAFNSDRLGDMNIWLKTLSDGAERQLTTGPGGDFQPNWAPDGSRIAFFSSRDGNVDIWSVIVATGELTQLTRNPSLDEDPFHSPDGKHIAFQSDRDGRLEVWVMDADGAHQRQISSNGASGHFMRWTPDGRAVIYRTSSDSGTNLYSQPLDGSPPRALPAIAGGYHISFSPDRRLILDVTGHRTLWVYPSAGGDSRQVFEFEDAESRIDYPVWSPDGHWVVFDRANYQGADIWLLEGVK